MKVITRKQRAKDAPKRWADTYDSTRWPDKHATTEALLRLPPQDRAPERIDEIIGNTSWTRVNCDECGEDTEAAVEIGQAPDYESCTAIVCRECLTKALAALDATD